MSTQRGYGFYMENDYTISFDIKQIQEEFDKHQDCGYSEIDKLCVKHKIIKTFCEAVFQVICEAFNIDYDI